MKPHINPGKNTNEENDLNGHRPGEGFEVAHAIEAHHPRPTMDAEAATGRETPPQRM